MKSVSILLLLLFLVITPHFISIAAQSHPPAPIQSPIPRELDVFTSPSRRNLLSHIHQNLEPHQDKTIVVLPDGTILLVEDHSGETLWAVPTGKSISSLYQAPSYEENNTLLHNDKEPKEFSIDIDAYLQTKAGWSVDLMQTIEEYFNGGSCIGIKKYTLLTIDFASGKLIEVIDPNEGLKASSGMKTSGLENGQQLSVKRTDYALVLFSEHQKIVQWNLTFSRIEASFLHQEGKQQIRVVHFRHDKHVQFLLGISRQNHEDAKSLIALESKQNMYAVDAGNTEQNSMALILVGTSEQNNTSCATTRDRLQTVAQIIGRRNHISKMFHYIRLPYIASVFFVLLFILWYSGNIAMTRKKISKQLDSSNGKTPVSSKRKKARKSGANTKPIAKGVLGYDVENSRGLSGDKRNDKEPWSYLEIPVDPRANGRMIGKLFISNTEIAKGSNGTVVVEGRYDGRPVAVKRLVQAYHDVAFKEIQNLIASDQHPNIVRWYGVEYDLDFVYVSLERCTCTLADLIKKCSDSSHQPVCTQRKSLNATKGIVKHVELWKASGYPSSQLLKLMRDIVSGLVHLHELGIIHRDLKPQNILIINEKSLCAKLSDMGISKRLLEDKSSLGHHPTGHGSSGWQAPEQLLNGRQTRAVDLFGLGCVLFFCITGGKHPYGEHLERDINIVKNRVDLFMVEHIPEAVDLLSQLLDPRPELRPTALHVLHHPLFWSSETRLSFLREASDRVEDDKESESDVLKELENVGPIAFGENWGAKMEAKFVNNIGNYRRYKFDSTRDLLRVVRNKLNHYRTLPEDIQELLGPVPEGYDGYFSSRFPKLLIEVYKVLYRFYREGYFREDEVICKYFKTM